MSIYLGIFKDKQNVLHEFSGSSYVMDTSEEDDKLKREFDSLDMIIAAYCYEHYSGDAFVLFRKDGKLFEVNGSHCSCNGLEGQWDPEETSKEAILKRINDNSYGIWSEFKKELQQTIEAL